MYNRPTIPKHKCHTLCKCLHYAQTSHNYPTPKIYAHMNHDYLQKMIKTRMITGYDLDETSKPEFCKSCTEAKMSWKPFPKISTGEKAKTYGDKVVCNLWGPA